MCMCVCMCVCVCVCVRERERGISVTKNLDKKEGALEAKPPPNPNKIYHRNESSLVRDVRPKLKHGKVEDFSREY